MNKTLEKILERLDRYISPKLTIKEQGVYTISELRKTPDFLNGTIGRSHYSYQYIIGDARYRVDLWKEEEKGESYRVINIERMNKKVDSIEVRL